jgi:HK97 family phage major capsid protein
MIDIKALRQQKTDLVKKNAALLSAAESANRDLTPAENTEYEANNTALASLNTRIARAETQMDAERNAPASRTIEVGHNNQEDKPFRSMGQQLALYAKGVKALEVGRAHLVDPRIQAALGTSESVPSDGGFLVEPEYDAALLQRIYDSGEVAKRCKRMAMKSARMIINAVDEDSRADGSRWGGVLSYWLAEAQTYAGTKPKFREVQLVANKLIALVYATEELLDDTDLLESYVNEIVPQEISFQLDAAIINGTGAGQPLGVLNSPSTIVQTYAAGEGSSGHPPSTDDILAMYSRLFAPYRKNAVWFINQSLEPGLLPLTLGSPSLGQYLIYTPAGLNGNNSPFGRLFGLPVIPIEQTASVGIAGDIILFGPDGYLLTNRNELRADSSIHVAFLTGEKAFRFAYRADGQPWWKKPLTPYAGVGGTTPPTLSSTVVLETR